LIAHIDSRKDLRAYGDSGIVEILIDSMIEEKDQSIKLSALPILENVKNQLIEKEKARIVLLQEKRSSLMVDNWRNEVTARVTGDCSIFECAGRKSKHRVSRPVACLSTFATDLF
jgi:hypothetical protein